MYSEINMNNRIKEIDEKLKENNNKITNIDDKISKKRKKYYQISLTIPNIRLHSPWSSCIF